MHQQQAQLHATMYVRYPCLPVVCECHTAMIDARTLDQILADMRRSLPGGFAQDMEKNLRAALSAALGRLNLVTREELEVQNAVLARTREKMAALEKQVAELEKSLRK